MIEIQYKATEDLIPYARNSRTHSAEQVAQIAASIREFGWTNPVLIDGENGIIAGHGRVLAAHKLGETQVPTIELSHMSDTQKRAYIIADNKLVINAGWDSEMLALEIEDLKEAGFDLGLTGFTLDEIADLMPEDITQGEDGKESGNGKLSDRFMLPPFSVLNAREGWWQDRKRAWLALGIKSELGRGGGDMTEPSASFKNQDKLKAFQQRQAAAPGQRVTTAKSSAVTARGGQ